MEDLRAQLISGECGVRWTPPHDLQVKRADATQLVLQAADRPLMWLIGESALGFAFDPAHDDVLYQDIVASSRAQFQGQAPDDPAWAPIVEHRRLALRGGPALRVIRRLALAPGKEIVVGHLVVPTTAGHLDFRAISREPGTTGLRETLLAATGVIENVAPADSRAVFDDPAHDAKFPNHPLSLVRRALDQLIETIEICAPARPLASGEIEIAPHHCVIIPPPRFVLMPPHPMMKPRGLMRIGLETWYRNLELWRIEDRVFEHRDPRGELGAFARATIEAWTREGVRNIATDVTPIDDFQNRPQVEQTVQMTVDEQSIFTLYRWWIEPDGVVYRLGTSGSADLAPAAHLDVLDAVQASWRRTDPIAPPTPPRKPWWRVW